MVAATLMLRPEQVGAETSLTSLDNSLGEAKLRLGLKRLGLQLPAGVRPVSFGELCERLMGTPPSPAGGVARMQPPSIPLLAGPRVGLDLQEVSALPAAGDYWEDHFYQGIFDKSEIAYAVLRPEPRLHFAGFWCAKEALRKCDGSFLGVDPTATAVGHDASGSPYLVWKSSGAEQRLPHSLSISHAGGIAMAVVMAVWPLR